MRAFCNQSSPETEGRIGFGNNLLSAAGVDEDKPISQNLLNKAVLKDPRIMAEIIGLGLHESSTCKQAAEVLHMYVKDLTLNERCELLPGIPWMTCCTPLPEVGQVVLVKDLLRKYPQWSHDSIAVVGNVSSKSVTEPKAKAALVWMLGEYAYDMLDAPYVLEGFVENWAEEESAEVHLIYGFLMLVPLPSQKIL
ncbi:unnamed protein product [Sphagnum jensenii]|uniref:Uncharacterized protein n=1 Tax=Sphagnum jensenii TaxID=128206 RepID=A0ABP1BN11_9BRYO